MSEHRYERLECCPLCGQPLLYVACFLCWAPAPAGDPDPVPANDDAEAGATPPPAA